MIKRGIVKGNLTVDSAEQRLNGLCPLMPEEVCLVPLINFIFPSVYVRHLNGRLKIILSIPFM